MNRALLLFPLVWLPPALRAPAPSNDPAPRGELDARAEELSRAHYAAVVRELRERDVEHLAPGARARRGELIDELARYREAGDFARHELDGRLRAPVFVDDEGRHCAVANLLRFTGEDELVSRVRHGDNHAWVADLGGDRELARWLERVGLTFDEAARIQAPSYHGCTPPPPPPQGDTVVPPSEPPGSGEPLGPLSPGLPTKTPLAPGAVPDGFAPASASPGGGGVGTPGGTPGGGPAQRQDWMTFWELNKLRWLEPRALAEAGAGGDDPRSSSGARLERARAWARDLFARYVDDPRAVVRERAVLGLAAVGGAETLPKIMPRLSDSNRHVRLAAVLALSLSSSEQGVHAALGLTLEQAAADVGPGARPFAFVALAVARANGLGSGVERMLPSLVGDDAHAQYALLLHQVLAPSAQLAGFVRTTSEAFDDRAGDRPQALTARATEALRHDRGEGLLSELLDELGDDAVPHRRAAALALGGVEGARAPLTTAFEQEREPLARAYALLSIAEHADPEARGFLLREFRRGRKAERPWAALALGLAAGATNDDELREALRTGYAEDRKRDRSDAYLLALGLAGDLSAEASTLLAGALASGDARTRGYAALGLGLAPRPAGRAALLAALPAESDPAALGRIALALALHGEPADASALGRALTQAKNPVSQGEIALALGFHGTYGAIEELVAALGKPELPDVARAAALDGLRLLLDGDRALVLPRVWAATDFTQLPWWVLELMRHTV
ncbi:MAG: HEAT repeat domain-containing protein [Planctomycetota bacterium]